MCVDAEGLYLKPDLLPTHRPLRPVGFEVASDHNPRADSKHPGYKHQRTWRQRQMADSELGAVEKCRCVYGYYCLGMEEGVAGVEVGIGISFHLRAFIICNVVFCFF